MISCSQHDPGQDHNSSGTSDSNQISNNKKDTGSLISIIAAGDVMPGTNYPSAYSLPPDDGINLFDSVKYITGTADVNFCNLEGTLLDSGGKPKKCNTPDNCVSFRIPEHYAGYLKDAGFDLVSTANNHSNDMGAEGKLSTINTLKKYDIEFAGYSDHPVTIFEKNGIIFGFTAFAPNNGTQNLNDIPNAVKVISDLRKKCKILIVSFHGGAEGYSAQRVSYGKEIYLGENRGNVIEFAHSAIDAGADIVIGHGPHVPRALELYKGKLIAYSLGNFCTYGKFSLSGPQGVAPLLKVFLNNKGNFVKGKIYSFKQINRGVPVPDNELSAVKLFKSLTEKDFPETPLIIKENGDVELSD
ncbi:MAG: CapA family protein [Ignavibacteria bacterium]|nr:CapA family protein [Ignavibacteria bacterium]